MACLVTPHVVERNALSLQRCGIAHDDGQPHCGEGRPIHRLATIDGRQRLGEDRVTPRSGGPMIARRLGGFDGVDASIGCGACSWQYRCIGCSTSRFGTLAITTRNATCPHLACSSHWRGRLCGVCLFSGTWPHIVQYNRPALSIIRWWRIGRSKPWVLWLRCRGLWLRREQ